MPIWTYQSQSVRIWSSGEFWTSLVGVSNAPTPIADRRNYQTLDLAKFNVGVDVGA